MKNTLKRILSLIMAMAMLMSVPVFAAAEEDSAELFSLLPLEEIEAEIDLSEAFPLELKNVKVSDVLEMLVNSDTGEAIEIDPEATTVWSSFLDEDGYEVYDGWKIYGMDDTMNLCPAYYNYLYDLQIIVGSGDQLDPENIRYIVDIKLPNPEDVLGISVYDQYAEGDSVIREEVGFDYYSGTYDNYKGFKNVAFADLEFKAHRAAENDYYLALSLNEESYPGIEINVYDGFYESAEAAVAAAEDEPKKDLTEAIVAGDMTQADAGYKAKWADSSNDKLFTIVYKRDGEAIAVENIAIYGWVYDRYDDYEYIDGEGYPVTTPAVEISKILEELNYNAEDCTAVWVNPFAFGSTSYRYDDEFIEKNNKWTRMSLEDKVMFYDRRMGIALKDSTGEEKVYRIYNENFENPGAAIDFSIYSQADDGARTEVSYSYADMYYSLENEKYIPVVYLSVAPSVDSNKAYYLSMDLKEEFAEGVNVRVFEGKYATAEDAYEAADKEVTASIIGQDMTQEGAGLKSKWFNWKDRKMVTVVYECDNETLVESFYLRFSTRYSNADEVGLFERIVEDEYDEVYAYYEEVSYDCTYDYEYDEKTYIEKQTYTYTLPSGYSADDKYYFVMRFYDAESDEWDNSKVKKAVVGHYSSYDKAKNQADIKEQLFPVEDVWETENEVGYKANFKKGVNFTVFAEDGDPMQFTVKVVERKSTPAIEEDDEIVEEPTIGSSDRYFNVNALHNGEEELDAYVVPYYLDTYYSNGYQAVLVNDMEADMTKVSPEAYVGDNAKVYFDGNEEVLHGDYYAKLSERDFTKAPANKRDPENAVKYTVAAENHKDLKNYWVTAVKKVEGAKLFVNGPDEREIFLNDYYNNAHDIFIANIGTEELTGITVTLKGENVKLDDYWTIKGEEHNKLAPFTETYHSGTYYGELANVAKIRLVPDGEGDIKATLTISADGQEDRVIKITGTAGNPQIDTKSLHDGVKYVPYSSIITTDNIHDWMKVSFELVGGNLPSEFKLYSDGEIYGVPKKAGEYKFTVRAWFETEEKVFCSKPAELKLTIKENTDKNVNATVDKGYAIQTRVPTVSPTSNKDVVFKVAGEFGEFIDFWLDGDKLEENIDYVAEEGSTKITIKAKTIKNLSKGQHTISAEFRVNGDRNKELKTASQNFTKGTTTSTQGPNTPSGGNGSAPANRVSNTSVPKINRDVVTESITTPVVVPETLGFADVNVNDWFYNDVKWAYENKLVQGYSETQFAPADIINGGMVVTVLARIAGVDVSAYANEKYEDVFEDQWYTPYAKWAKAVGLVDGLVFNPPTEIDREWMGIVIKRFIDYMKVEYEAPATPVEFKDAEFISETAMDAIQVLFKYEILIGRGDHTIDPLNKTTRAEFATLMHRVYNFINK